MNKFLNSQFKKILNGILYGFYIFLGFFITGTLVVYAINLSTVNTGDSLSASSYNALIATVNTLSSYGTWQKNGNNINFTGTNVGIGVPNPSTKLDVNGTIKATKLDIGQGSFIRIVLAQCGGACVGNHTLNTWQSGGSWAWNTVYNNDSLLYSKTNGIITINQSGTYLIRLYYMAMTSVAASYAGGGYYCPFINGTANCLGENGITHKYTPLGNWDASHHDFIQTFSAGTTVTRGYSPQRTMSYWGHDQYVALEIIRIN